MNMAKKLVLAAGLTLLGGAAAFGEYARGYFNDGDRRAADGFGSCPIAKGSVDFGQDDAKFDIDPTAGSVTQTATANIGNATEKFFKAAIEVDVSNNEDP